MKTKIKELIELLLITALVLILVCIVTENVGAQSLKAGVTAGASTGSVKISDIPQSLGNVIKGDNIMGINAGVFAKLSISSLYINPQLLVNYRHGTVDVFQDEISKQEKSFTMEKLEIPVLVGLRVIGPLCIEAGPVYNYILHSTSDFGNDEVHLKKDGMGYRAGINFDFGRINVYGNYQGITNNKSASSDVESSFKSPYELVFGLGLKFGKSEK